MVSHYGAYEHICFANNGNGMEAFACIAMLIVAEDYKQLTILVHMCPAPTQRVLTFQDGLPFQLWFNSNASLAPTSTAFH